MSEPLPEARAVHVLRQGRALCGFSDRVPLYWPEGHFWVAPEDRALVTCQGCASVLSKDEVQP